jgi:SAM-dependent methyltransferase
MSWSATQYSLFEQQRTRPVRDLVAAIPLASAQAAVDLGCGPGNSTEVLAERFPEATVTGLDSSDDMLRDARQRLPNVAFELADIGAWTPAQTCDVILANASLQWVPDHAALYPRLVSRLNAGGVLAVQTPDNLEEPAHRLAASHTRTDTQRPIISSCCDPIALRSMSGAPRITTRLPVGTGRWSSGSRDLRCGPICKSSTRPRNKRFSKPICRQSARPTRRWTTARCCCRSRACSSLRHVEACGVRESSVVRAVIDTAVF